MVVKEFSDSVYRFTDPVRFFKANDPYYFEVDNIPLKQLQENDLWLKDQIFKKTLDIKDVKRADIDELRPYALGSDRVVRVKPGRYTARINDVSHRDPLAFLQGVMGEALGDVDAWDTATPNAGSFPFGTIPSFNSVLRSALDRFKVRTSQDALGMAGLVERAFTWPVVNVDVPVNSTGVKMTDGGYLKYGDWELNNPGGNAVYSPTLITEAIVWAKSLGDGSEKFLLPTFDTANTQSGFSKLPLTESYFIRKWRGVSRLAIVDVGDELNVEVPIFDPADFSYIDENGTEILVPDVDSRIDLVFIYSKPVDTSSATILKSTTPHVITKPQLGIVRGAGIKVNFQSKLEFEKGHPQGTGDDHKILAAPGDQLNSNMGFTATSGNDIKYDVRGSFPAPDDILNIAPLICEKLESTAYELIGQSIMPVAYVWVKGTGDFSTVVLDTDVIDIRPFFRTAELAYNERAGIGAAMPQLSLANPAVGKAQLDLEMHDMFDYVNAALDSVVAKGASPSESMETVAAGYVFGGWQFGPEGTLFDYYRKTFAATGDSTGDSITTIQDYITQKYGYGNAGASISVPDYPDWDLARWAVEQDSTAVPSKGSFPNDYLNVFQSNNTGGDYYQSGSQPDDSMVAGSIRTDCQLGGAGGGQLCENDRLTNFSNTYTPYFGSQLPSKAHFYYISKRIKFDRGSVPWLADYHIGVDLINSLPLTYRGHRNSGSTAPNRHAPGGYTGWWVEKGYDEFVIYIAFAGKSNNGIYSKTVYPTVPAPYYVGSTLVTKRDGDRFSNFVVPVEDILYSDTSPISLPGQGYGYTGNPRMGKCTYPTIMWTMTGISNQDASFLYGNLNATNPVITIKS